MSFHKEYAGNKLVQRGIKHFRLKKLILVHLRQTREMNKEFQTFQRFARAPVGASGLQEPVQQRWQTKGSGFEKRDSKI